MSLDEISHILDKIPQSLANELAFVYERYQDGLEEKATVDALVEDALSYIEETEAIDVVTRPIATKTGVVMELNPRIPFTLTSEPTDPKFKEEDPYIILNQHTEAYRPDSPLEVHNRSMRPLDITRYPEFGLDDTPRTIGCDIARFGSDKCVSICQEAGIVLDIQSWWNSDAAETISNILMMAREWLPSEIILDATGFGGAIEDILRETIEAEDLFTITGVVFNGKPREDRWNALNARAEMYLLLAERLRVGNIILPNHKELIEELINLKYEHRGGMIKIEDKDKTRKRIKRSPDYADALALAFYGKGDLQVYV